MRCSLLTYVKILIAAACVLPVFLTASCSKDSSAEGLSVPFSHKTHVENYGIEDCGTCHKYDAYGTFKGLPTVGECIACHKGDGKLYSDDRKSNPRKKTMFDSYTAKDRLWESEVEDSKIYYYSHKIVMTSNIADGKTKVRCDLCHGDKASSSGKAKMKGEKLMEQCIYCHTSYKLNNDCTICHR